MPTRHSCGPTSSTRQSLVERRLNRDLLAVGWRVVQPCLGRCGNRVLRGGSWNNNARNTRSANRNRNAPDNRNNNNGFRVCLCLSTLQVFGVPKYQCQNWPVYEPARRAEVQSTTLPRVAIRRGQKMFRTGGAGSASERPAGSYLNSPVNRNLSGGFRLVCLLAFRRAAGNNLPVAEVVRLSPPSQAKLLRIPHVPHPLLKVRRAGYSRSLRIWRGMVDPPG